MPVDHHQPTMGVGDVGGRSNIQCRIMNMRRFLCLRFCLAGRIVFGHGSLAQYRWPTLLPDSIRKE